MVAHRPSSNDIDYRQMWRDMSFRSVAEATTSLIVDFLLVVDVTAGSSEQSANHRALTAADQRATQCAYPCADARALDRIAPGVFAVVIVVIVITVTTEAVTSEIVIVVVPCRVDISATAATVLRHRARSGGRQQQPENYHQNHALLHFLDHFFLHLIFGSSKKPPFNLISTQQVITTAVPLGA